MLESFVQILLEFSRQSGYLGILVLMIIESSFIPFPSEVVIPPAAYLAQQGEMNIYLVVVFGIAGSLLGALFNYYIALWLGRPLVYKLANKRIARFLLLSEEKIKKAEAYFLNYGSLSTFVGRLIPGIRQLISLPAGFVRMPFKSFLFFTFLGSGLWTIILALQGYLIGVYRDLFIKYLFEIILGIILFAVAVFVLFKYLKRRKSGGKSL